MAYIIAGIDSGKTSAYACLDLDGKLIASGHKTFAGSDWIVGELGKVGTPCIVATDRRRPNPVIRKVNAAFNSLFFMPERELSSSEKREFAKSVSLRNRHEQDAYASAIKAYYSHANTLNKARSAISGMPRERQDTVKARIIRKHSIAEAIANRRANRR